MGLDLAMVEQAVGVRPRRRTPAGRPIATAEFTDIDTRLERELLRSVLVDGGAAAAAGVSAEDFAVPDVRKAFELVAESLNGAQKGQPVEIPRGDGPEVNLLIDLATMAAPAANLSDALWRVRVRGLDRRIDTLREQANSMHPDDQGYTGVMDELVRLQKARRERENG